MSAAIKPYIKQIFTDICAIRTNQLLYSHCSEVNRHCNETTDFKCMDLAKQLILEHPMINVLLGGGQENFYPNTSPLPSNTTQKGSRSDGLFLADIWQSTLRDKGRSAEYAGSAAELHEKVLTRPDYLLGR